MSLDIRYFVNHKTRMCRMLSGPAEGKDHLDNIKEAAKEGFAEVSSPDELEAFREDTQKAKDAGWNPNRIGYAKFMAKQVKA